MLKGRGKSEIIADRNFLSGGSGSLYKHFNEDPNQKNYQNSPNAFGQLHRGLGESPQNYKGRDNRKIRSMKDFDDGAINAYDVDFKIEELNRRNLNASDSDPEEQDEVNQDDSLLDNEYYQLLKELDAGMSKKSHKSKKSIYSIL